MGEVCCPQACRPQTGRNQKIDDADSYLPHHQPIRRMSMSRSHPLRRTMAVQLLATHSRSGHTVLRALAHCPRLPGKAIKLFFSTSPKTLSPRFNSVSGHRVRIRLQDQSLMQMKIFSRNTLTDTLRNNILSAL